MLLNGFLDGLDVWVRPDEVADDDSYFRGDRKAKIARLASRPLLHTPHPTSPLLPPFASFLLRI